MRMNSWTGDANKMASCTSSADGREILTCLSPCRQPTSTFFFFFFFVQLVFPFYEQAPSCLSCHAHTHTSPNLCGFLLLLASTAMHVWISEVQKNSNFNLPYHVLSWQPLIWSTYWFNTCLFYLFIFKLARVWSIHPMPCLFCCSCCWCCPFHL